VDDADIEGRAAHVGGDDVGRTMSLPRYSDPVTPDTGPESSVRSGDPIACRPRSSRAALRDLQRLSVAVGFQMPSRLPRYIRHHRPDVRVRAVAVVRSYSPHLGAISTEQDTNILGANRDHLLQAPLVRGILNDHRKHTPRASTLRTRRWDRGPASDSFSGPPPREAVDALRDAFDQPLGNDRRGLLLEGKCTTWRCRGDTPREPRMMWIASSCPGG